MTAHDHRTTCCQRIGTHGPGSWEGHPMPCGRDSVARHPGCEERYDGICRWHLAMYEAEPFPWTATIPLRRPDPPRNAPLRASEAP